jgi:hypothetical protein
MIFTYKNILIKNSSLVFLALTLFFVSSVGHVNALSTIVSGNTGSVLMLKSTGPGSACNLHYDTTYYSITFIANSSIANGGTVNVGDVITFTTPFDPTQIVWSSGVTPATVANGVWNPPGGAVGLSYWIFGWEILFFKMTVPVPSVSVTATGLTCTGLTCTVDPGAPSVINASVNFVPSTFSTNWSGNRCGVLTAGHSYPVPTPSPITFTFNLAPVPPPTVNIWFSRAKHGFEKLLQPVLTLSKFFQNS